MQSQGQPSVSAQGSPCTHLPQPAMVRGGWQGRREPKGWEHCWAIRPGMVPLEACPSTALLFPLLLNSGLSLRIEPNSVPPATVRVQPKVGTFAQVSGPAPPSPSIPPWVPRSEWVLVLRDRSVVMLNSCQKPRERAGEGRRGPQYFRGGKGAPVSRRDGFSTGREVWKPERRLTCGDAQKRLLSGMVRTRAKADRKARGCKKEGLPGLLEAGEARRPHLPLPGLERPLVVGWLRVAGGPARLPHSTRLPSSPFPLPTPQTPELQEVVLVAGCFHRLRS